MCSYIVEKARMNGSAKGPNGWMRIDSANVYTIIPITRRSTMRSASISSAKRTADAN